MRTKIISALLILTGTVSLAGCNNADRSLCLFTDTTVGFELTFDSKAANPAKAILGYNRSEGLLNPVYSETKSARYSSDSSVARERTVTPTYRDDAYSVIVKMNGHRQAQASPKDARKGNGQLFITGKAAQMLAQNPIAVAALTDDTDVALEAVRTAETVEIARAEARGRELVAAAAARARTAAAR